MPPDHHLKLMQDKLHMLLTSDSCIPTLSFRAPEHTNLIITRCSLQAFHKQALLWFPYFVTPHSSYWAITLTHYKPKCLLQAIPQHCLPLFCPLAICFQSTSCGTDYTKCRSNFGLYQNQPLTQLPSHQIACIKQRNCLSCLSAIYSQRRLDTCYGCFPGVDPELVNMDHREKIRRRIIKGIERWRIWMVSTLQLWCKYSIIME